MSKFKTHKNEKILMKCAKIGGRHLHSGNNHCAKFEYKGMKSVFGTDYTQIPQCKQWRNNNV